MSKRTMVEESSEERDSVEYSVNRDLKVAFSIKVYGNNVEEVTKKVADYKEELVKKLGISLVP